MSKPNYHVTRALPQGIYGHETTCCDPSGCNASRDWYLCDPRGWPHLRAGDTVELDLNAPEPAEPEVAVCPACGGDGVTLGNLGAREHYRCRQCGIDFSTGGGL